MKHFIISLSCIFALVWISACNSQTTIANPTNTPAPQFSASKKTSLEVYRNGKVYEILIGYSLGRAPFYATPVGKTPKIWSEALADGAQIEAFSDLDHDDEREILVSVYTCGAYCSNQLMVYEYDPTNDKYFVSDVIWANLREYTDFNKDGTPEFTLWDYGFCFQCSHATAALSALIILQYDEGKFVDVSTEYPELIQQDADSFLEAAKTNDQNAAQVTLPGYLFNMYRLGKLEEGRLVFDEVCNKVLKLGTSNSTDELDCMEFRLVVEKSIMEYKIQ